MTWQIACVFLLLIVMLASFAWEKIPNELTAMIALSLLLVLGILPTHEALAVFANPAPITVGAMFIISAALERCGAMQYIGAWLQSIPNLTPGKALLLLILIVAAASAFINNTPVVIVFLPIALSLAKQASISASKLLIPLSYASIFGGSCTLIGTSTNIVVSSIAVQRGLSPISMFELAWVGLPLLIAGTLYLLTVGYRIIPTRETTSDILSQTDSREYILEAFVETGSPLEGRQLFELESYRSSHVRALEIFREGVTPLAEAERVTLQLGDRVLLAASVPTLDKAKEGALAETQLLSDLGLAYITTRHGKFVEVALRENTPFSGYTLAELNFQNRFALTPVALHRRGHIVRSSLRTTPIREGDILLLRGSQEAIENLGKQPEFVVLDEPLNLPDKNRINLFITLATIAGVIGASSLNLMPIAGAAIIGSTFLMATGCLQIRDAYRSINWPILFLIFAMLGVGRAVEVSGASDLIAGTLVRGIATLSNEAWQPILLLAGVYLLTTVLTEILSNNAVAVLLTTLAIGAAETLGVDARPYIIAVAMGASASFATPIGYQTNTYVHGVGGYRFADFLKVGIPLNLIAFVVTIVIVPFIWPLR
ncbi:SLC13 family permease [Pelagicoccus sp. SDUM812002]|uniref:SLC13 family permease n=1 Tax=Pelagicoccus sp. SDUM812002 TaxID=3041266 RepID=UPI00280F8DCF|nr:SLC13 family permease [Pelagicoccus sp. SDUM812002]MDQ8185777.1 SLC13 family permease [Pelagicoccus sp. SDUM812002]